MIPLKKYSQPPFIRIKMVTITPCISARLEQPHKMLTPSRLRWYTRADHPPIEPHLPWGRWCG